MQLWQKKAEQKAIFETIQERKNTPDSEYISYDDKIEMQKVLPDIDDMKKILEGMKI